MGEKADALLERLLGSLIGAAEVMSIYTGDRLGLYAGLSDGPLTSRQLADKAGIAERYAREWLEQQAVAGFLEVDDVASAAADRRYSLPQEHAEVLLHRDAPTYLAPYTRMFVASAGQMPKLLEAYRNGGGVGWAEFGPDMSEGQESGNRPTYINALAEWFGSVPDVHATLSGGARMADVGCGGGWSSISLAKAYPTLRVDGFDLDEAAVARAQANAEREGVGDRVRFRAVSPADVDHGTGYDLVTAFECIHDMPQPVPVLRSMREMAGDSGTVIVMDENVQPEFTVPGDEIERLMYGFSLMVCLPDSMSSPGSVGTGTVMRPSVFQGYAEEAGFTGVEILPIDGGFWRFYRLTA